MHLMKGNVETHFKDLVVWVVENKKFAYAYFKQNMECY